MKLITGLGNPGQKYEKTRHNLGWQIIDEFMKKHQISPCQEEKRFKAQTAVDVLGSEKIILAKPQTFMNNSGWAVRALVDYYKIQPVDILIIHDDIDLPLGEIRYQKNRGAAGHQGVRSIIEALKTKDFARIRTGIAPPDKAGLNTEEFVLQKFTADEEKIIRPAIKKAAQLITEAFLEKKFD